MFKETGSFLAKIKDLRDTALSQSKLLAQIERRLTSISHTLFEMQMQEYCSRFEKGVAPLACFGESNNSQHGEDGMIREIFRRIGVTPATFVEIGAGDGTENNTLHLVFCGATGIWIEADEKQRRSILTHHEALLEQGTVTLVGERINADNVNPILQRASASPDLDLLSIDIDGNDYWVWKAIDVVDPKVVVIEYNSDYGSSASWIMKYDPDYVWPGQVSYYGASLKALEKLGRSKGYALVGCDFQGVNAFFLKTELVGDRFPGPHDSEHMYQPFRGYVGRWPRAKQPRFGPFETV